MQVVFEVGLPTKDSATGEPLDCLWIVTDKPITLPPGSSIEYAKQIDIELTAPGIDMVIE